MFEILESLCGIDGVSGDEDRVREFIISKIDGFCQWKIDALGNIIAFKNGAERGVRKLMIDAHMDEVGLIVTGITQEGFLKFKTVGGIDTSAIMFRNVRLKGSIPGVVCGKPVHLITAEERKRLPEADELYIDIGAQNREEAAFRICPGDRAVICGEYTDNGKCIISKAIDDRIGCAVLTELIRGDSRYDFYASFSVQEEVGLRGAKTAAFGINPDSALVIEATTASDIAGVTSEKAVCRLGEGPAVSFMDNATVYDRAYYSAALNSGIKCQPKSAVAGGNNSGAVHLNRQGVRTLALSLPCRYIHSPSSVANKEDCEKLLELARYMLNGICSGEIK